jgi:CheY-like chemotaxis protein
MKALRKVLVVDDDPVVGKSIDRILSSRGYAVIAAAGGEEALDRLAREDYDVVYTDIKMPGMSGLEVARHIKESRPWLPVVIVTGYGNDANEAEARDIGVNGFLRKPLSPEMIESTADELTNKPDLSMTSFPLAPNAIRAVEPEVVTRENGAVRFVKNVALFIAAPFIGLAYILAAPFVGFALLAREGYRAWKEPAAPK